MRDPAQCPNGYSPAPPLPGGKVLPVPAITTDLAQARADLSESGICLVGNALSASEVTDLRDALTRQVAAEHNLGERCPHSHAPGKLLVPNMVNKGRVFLDLVEHSLTDELGAYLLGDDFLLSSLTGHLFTGPTTSPQILHRDQGHVPPSAEFPAACSLFWLLDDFTATDGSTCVVPGSHRWPVAWRHEPPDHDLTVQLEAPAGTVIAWDGRMWHGTGVSTTGNPRRNIAVYGCLPWLRQQENWGVTCLQEVLDEASPKLRARLGLRSYGTLGQISGTRVTRRPRPQDTYDGYDVFIPEHVIGEGGALHPMRRVRRGELPS